MDALEVLAIVKTDARAWAYVPYALERVARFCHKFDSDADQLMLVAQLQVAFVTPNPESQAQMFLFLEGGQVMGHALVTVEHWFGTKMATIVQMESEKPVPRKLARETLAKIEDWANERGCQYVQCVARNETVARVFSTFYGFEKRAVVMRKSLKETPSTVVADGEKDM